MIEKTLAQTDSNKLRTVLIRKLESNSIFIEELELIANEFR
jgi:hypothetical protein